MARQLNLPGVPAPVDVYPDSPGFEKGSDTSEEAAQSIEPHARWMQRLILEILRDATEGMTDDRLEEVTNQRHQTISARRRECVLKGWVEQKADPRTGGKARRQTRSGRTAAVWVITTAGEAALEAND